MSFFLSVRTSKEGEGNQEEARGSDPRGDQGTDCSIGSSTQST